MYKKLRSAAALLLAAALLSTCALAEQVSIPTDEGAVVVDDAAIPESSGAQPPDSSSVPADEDDGLYHVSAEMTELIKSYEGFRPCQHGSSQCYIGYGTSCQWGEYPDGIDEETASQLLKDALAESESELYKRFDEELITGMTQQQFDVLVDFTFNMGAGWLYSESRFLDCILAGFEGCTESQLVNAVGAWCHIGTSVSTNLISRRMAEARILVYGDYTGESSPQWEYLILDADGGSLDFDVYFYKSGEPYGQLPPAYAKYHDYFIWLKPDGSRLLSGETVESSMTVTALWSNDPYPDEPDIDPEEPDVVAPESPDLFTDVFSGDWYYDSVLELCASGAVSGYPDGSFRPEDQVTAGAALKLILMAIGCEAQEPVGDHWASGYLFLAVEHGVTTPEQFWSLDQIIDRRTVAQLASRALGYSGKGMLTPFSDCDEELVTAMYEVGVITGSEDKDGSLIFRPNDPLTRAELCAIVCRLSALA